MKSTLYLFSIGLFLFCQCVTTRLVMDQQAYSRYQLANDYVTQKRYFGALVIYNELLKQFPDDARLHNSRGLVFEKLKQNNNAFQDYNRAIQLAPKVPDYYYDRAIIYSAFGNYSQAMGDVSYAIGLNSSVPKYFLLKALIYKNQRNYAAAISEYQQLGQRFSNYQAKGYFETGQIYLSQQNYSLGIPVYSTAIRLYIDMAKVNPEFKKSVGVSYNQRGVCYFRLGQYNPALMDFLSAIIYAPLEGLYHSNTGEAYLKMGKNDKALQWAKSACKYQKCSLLRTIEKEVKIDRPPVIPGKMENKKELDKKELRELFKTE